MFPSRTQRELKLSKHVQHLNIKIIALSLFVFILGFSWASNTIFRTHNEQVSIFLIDSIPKHKKRWAGGIKELSPAKWNAHMLIEGKNVVCDIPSSLYSTFKKLSNINRIGLLHYHHAFFSNEIICDQLDVAATNATSR